jgi:oxygen-independent coproporphyrinogen-3 oxidase
MQRHQQALESLGLPTPDDKLELFLLTARGLVDAGYVAVGMDHFALPTDPLVTALHDGTLRRTFMGYTTGRGLDTLGLGASAISWVGSSYSQDIKQLDPYVAAVNEGRLPLLRGHLLTTDDEIRRELLLELFCTLRADLDGLGAQFGIDAADYFADDLRRLQPMVDDGLVTWTRHAIEVTELGRLFVRNVCMTFDRYLEGDPAQRRYSRTV